MTLMGHDIKASDLFVAALENEGVTHIFALPGPSIWLVLRCHGVQCSAHWCSNSWIVWMRSSCLPLMP